jgi:outer membrane protein assembly factor BamB
MNGLVLTAGRECAAEDWPQFRGPTGLGYSAEKDLPLHWGGGEKKNVLWTAPLRGEGHASPIVWDGRVFVATALWPEGTSDRKKVIPEHHLACYLAADGALAWDTQVQPGPWLRDDFRSGPGGGYAAPTPATDGRLVFAVFGSSVIAALDRSGKLAWRREIVPYSFDVTIGTSPILYQGAVILLCAMAKKEDSRVVAWDARTGEPKWEAKLSTTGFGHSTPVVIDVKGKPQMVFAASGMQTARDACLSLDPASGRRIWSCKGNGDAASVAYASGVLYFDGGRGGPGFALDPAGEGDLSETRVRWSVAQVPEGISSPIIVGERVYRLHEPGILKCWRLSDGSLVSALRLDGLGSTWASPIADPLGRIYYASGGKSFVIQSGEEPAVLAVNDLGDANHPSPAASRGRLFIVGRKNLYCVGEK